MPFQANSAPTSLRKCKPPPFPSLRPTDSCIPFVSESSDSSPRLASVLRGSHLYRDISLIDHSFCPRLWLLPGASSPRPADMRSPLCLNRNTEPHARPAPPVPLLSRFTLISAFLCKRGPESHLYACPPVSSQPITAWLPSDTVHHQGLWVILPSVSITQFQRSTILERNCG